MRNLSLEKCSCTYDTSKSCIEKKSIEKVFLFGLQTPHTNHEVALSDNDRYSIEDIQKFNPAEISDDYLSEYMLMMGPVYSRFSSQPGKFLSALNILFSGLARSEYFYARKEADLMRLSAVQTVQYIHEHFLKKLSSNVARNLVSLVSPYNISFEVPTVSPQVICQQIRSHLPNLLVRSFSVTEIDKITDFAAVFCFLLLWNRDKEAVAEFNEKWKAKRYSFDRSLMESLMTSFRPNEFECKVKSSRKRGRMDHKKTKRLNHKMITKSLAMIPFMGGCE